MSILKSAPLRQSQHNKKPSYLVGGGDVNLSTNSSSPHQQINRFNSDTGVSTKSFEQQFFKSTAVAANESIAAPSNDVYNIPWDFKNKLLTQQQQSAHSTLSILKPPPIQPPPPPLPTSNVPQLLKPAPQQQEYCAPWDLKLQEDRLKNLTTETTKSTVTATSEEYSPPWDQKQQNILLKQFKEQQQQKQQQQVKLSISCSSSSSSLSSANSASPKISLLPSTHSPAPNRHLKVFSSASSLPPEQQQQQHAAASVEKFNSLDSNTSSVSNKSFEGAAVASSDLLKPQVKPRQSFRASAAAPVPPPLLPTTNSTVQLSSASIILSKPAPPPLPQTPAYMVTLEKQTWYHGRITRRHAETLLQGMPVGSFLVRQSESGNTNDFSLSLVGSGCVHMRICMKNGEFILGQCSQPFASIIKMIEHYSKVEVPIKGALHVKLIKPIFIQ